MAFIEFIAHMGEGCGPTPAAEIEETNHEHIQKNLGRSCRVVYRSDSGEYAGVRATTAKTKLRRHYG